jgi:hypothetical protein
MAAAEPVCAGFLRLFVESYINEHVKSTFDQAIEKHEAVLDLLKLKALKDFGLFVEKRPEFESLRRDQLKMRYLMRF